MTIVIILTYVSATSLHSRAARRAASPSVDVDKSLKSLPRAETTVIPRESVLHGRTNAGITKKQAKLKPQSRAQRLRQQKGIERAEAVLDQMEKKFVKSIKRSKTVKERRVGRVTGHSENREIVWR